MSDKRGTLREISWRDLCPWLLLFRTFRLAVGLPLLTLGTLAAVLTPIGWRGAEFVFLGDQSVQSNSELRGWVLSRQLWPNQQFDYLAHPSPLESPADSLLWAMRGEAATLLYRDGIAPFVHLLNSRRFELREWAYLLAGTVWTLGVWGWLGGAINRIAVVRLGCEQAVGLREALRFSRRRLRSYIFAPLMPLVGVAFAVIPCALIGLAMRADWGMLVGGAAWLVVLLLSFIMLLLLVCVGLGWPLMWGAISAERDGDEFEAINRSFSFALGRPLHYLFYFLVIAVVGGAGTLIVDWVAQSTIATARWSASWGTGGQRWDEIVDVEQQSHIGDDVSDEQQPTLVGLQIVNLWEEFVRTVAVGFRHSFFWVAAGGIYLLLRRQIDETELDDIYLEDLEPLPQLPPLDAPTPTPSTKPDGGTDSTPTSAAVPDGVPD